MNIRVYCGGGGLSINHNCILFEQKDTAALAPAFSIAHMYDDGSDDDQRPT